MAIVTRLLTYEGSRDWIEKTFKYNKVPAGGIIKVNGTGTIKSQILAQSPANMVDETEVSINYDAQRKYKDEHRNDNVPCERISDDVVEQIKLLTTQLEREKKIHGITTANMQEYKKMFDEACKDANNYLLQRNEAIDNSKAVQADLRKLKSFNLDLLEDNRKLHELNDNFENTSSYSIIKTLREELKEAKERSEVYKEAAKKWRDAYNERKRQTFAMAYGSSRPLNYETTKTKERGVEYAQTPSGKEVCTMAWRCDSCGTKAFGKDRYCRNCGKRFISN